MEDDVAAIKELADQWVEAVGASDAKALAQLMTDDIVVIHGNGRVSAGREAVVAEFIIAFSAVRMVQTIQRAETVVAGGWAMDRARVHTTVENLRDGTRNEHDAHTVTIVRKSESGDWRVARAIGVVEQH